MLPDEFNNRNKLDKKYYIVLMERDEYEPETPAQNVFVYYVNENKLLKRT